MASWAVHFRICDYFLDKIHQLDTEYFIIGNIAPDCGVPAKDGYSPHSEITHRTHSGNYKGNCDYQSVYDDFINGENDVKIRSFWIGYYVHLMTDCLWVQNLCENLLDNFKNLDMHSETAKIIRKEWYNLDNEFFAENASPSFELFKTFKGFNEDYPDFYKNNEISNRMKYIVSFYGENKPCEMKYKYTTPDMVEKFIRDTQKTIYSKVNEFI